MPTIDDLRDALVAREAHAPHADSFELVQRRSRQRFAAPAVAAAAVLVLAGTATLIATRDENNAQQSGAGPSLSSVPLSGSAPPATSTAPVAQGPLTWGFSVAKVPGYTITRYLYAPGEQSAHIVSATSGGARGYLTLMSAPGLSNGVNIVKSRGVAVMVAGKQGYFLPGTKPLTGRPTDDGDSQPHLVWEYAPDSWADITGTFGWDASTGSYDGSGRATELKIAAAVTTAASDDRIEAPFVTGYLPADLEPLVTSFVQKGRSCLGYSIIGASYDSTQGWLGSLLTLCRFANSLPPENLYEPTDHVVTRTLSDGTTLQLEISKSGLASFPESILEKIVNNTDVSPQLDDASTWLPIP